MHCWSTGVAVLSPRELFLFVIDKAIGQQKSVDHDESESSDSLAEKEEQLLGELEESKATDKEEEPQTEGDETETEEEEG